MLVFDIKKRRFIFEGIGKLALLATGASIWTSSSSNQGYVVTSVIRLPKALPNSNPEVWQFYRRMGLAEVDKMTQVLNQARIQGKILSRKAKIISPTELVVTTRWRSYDDFKQCYSNPRLVSALSVIQSRVEVQTSV